MSNSRFSVSIYQGQHLGQPRVLHSGPGQQADLGLGPHQLRSHQGRHQGWRRDPCGHRWPLAGESLSPLGVQLGWVSLWRTPQGAHRAAPKKGAAFKRLCATSEFGRRKAYMASKAGKAPQAGDLELAWEIQPQKDSMFFNHLT